MSAAALDLGSASRMLRDALRDNRYKRTPLGLEVVRYIRWKRTEWGASPDTIITYEPILARLAVFFADLTVRDFEVPDGIERLRECMDFYWAESAPATKQKTIAVWRDFFEWAIDNGLILSNPARKLKNPKLRDVRREPFPRGFVEQVTGQQEHLCDRLGVSLILRYGLRRAELAGVRFRDFTLTPGEAFPGQLVLQGKGGKVRVIPIIDESFMVLLASLELELGGPSVARDLYLLCPRRKVLLGTSFYHYRNMKPRAISQWWYDRLEEAGVIVKGDRTGQGMHRGRHTVATDILRRTGNIVAAKELLGHSSTAITEKFYATFDTNDLAAALRASRDD